MSLLDPCLIRSRGPSGQVVVQLGVPLVDDYLEFVEAGHALLVEQPEKVSVAIRDFIDRHDD